MQQSDNIIYIDINNIVPNTNQPRKNFNEDTLKELATSIKEYGILNPILVRKKNNKYEIVAGERRYRAAKMIGLSKLPAIVKELTDNKVTEIALIENLQRENITPIEEADTYQKILTSSNITEQRLSEMIGKSQSAISNKLRLLNLSDAVKDALRERKISERHARSILTIKDKKKQEELLNKVISERLTVKELDNIINESHHDANNTTEESINKKEIEKESDNMNNGNFFPNYNNQEPNNNVSLNTMNMQSMPSNENNIAANFNQPVQNTMVQPITFNASTQPDINMQQPIINQEQVSPMAPAEPVPIQPSVAVNNMDTVSQQPIIPPIDNQPIAANTEPMNNLNDIPLFANQNIAPETQEITTPAPEPVMENTQQVVQPTPVVEDVPLFNNPSDFQPKPEPTNNVQTPETFEVPVETMPPLATEDKFTTVKNLLDANSVAYKAYTGSNGSCIIIEL